MALGLDLTLRTRFEGLTLDHLMREMWRRHGAVPDPYDVADVEAALARVTGDEAFAREFFDRYVRGRDVPDYVSLLGAAGIELARAHPDAAWIGQPALRYEDGAALVLGPTRIGTPLYEAGLDRGDRLLELDGAALGSPEDLVRVLAAHAPGDVVEVRFESRGEVRDATLTLAENPELVARLSADTGGVQADFRASWKSSTAS